MLQTYPFFSFMSAVQHEVLIFFYFKKNSYYPFCHSEVFLTPRSFREKKWGIFPSKDYLSLYCFLFPLRALD